MAGIEQLEVHSKSYIVRWVNVEEGHTLSWSLQPHKKSINLGIVKHPGAAGTKLSSLADDPSHAERPTSVVFDAKLGHSLSAKKDASTALEQLSKKGFILITWHGKCEADKVSTGTYNVPPAGTGGMFGLILDNTFSKQTSKTATLVILTYPTGAPPQTAANPPNLQAAPAAGSSGKAGAAGAKLSSPPRTRQPACESLDSLQSHTAGGLAVSVAGRSDADTPSSATHHVGNLLKRRRKKGQGYARRYFSLDFTTCTLSYFHNRASSALRGAIPLSLAAIAADERRREISIDSGAEIWHLRAPNAKDFADWAAALDLASRITNGLEPSVAEPGRNKGDAVGLLIPGPIPNTQQEEDREWKQVEALVSRIVGTRDALRRLVKDTAAQNRAPGRSSQTPTQPHAHASSLQSPSEEPEGYFIPALPEKRPFWKRKPSAPSPLTPHSFQSAVSSTLAVASPNAITTVAESGAGKKKWPSHEEHTTHSHCTALLNDLDSVVVQFSALLATSKRRRMPVPPSVVSRKSYESASTTDEFFDAEVGDPDLSHSQLMIIDHQSEEDTPASDAEEVMIHESSSVSSVEDGEEEQGLGGGSGLLFPAKPKSLAPLPITDSVARRRTIPPATVQPPSLIAFVRKNVGKDLSTISMPVSANEPISMLQRVAEQLEYAQLLDEAARHRDPTDRLLMVAAFAVSQFSNGRVKERSMRKPFSPLLGETFELVRSEAEAPGGFRLLVEKVTHRPVRLAMQADGALWSLSQSPAPTQRFWGKSAELLTEGRMRLTLRLPDSGGAEERYSWAAATVFLRNVVMGEKYFEPTGTMSVVNDGSGAKAVVEFRSSRGMFGGRGEDVHVATFAPDGSPNPTAGASLTGTWTGSLRVPGVPGSSGREIWAAGPVVLNAASTYGLTVFAATLNEITRLEEGRLPPTDCRLRPDQRLAERGDLDAAEDWKARLEEGQRLRRRQLEERGEEHRPRWFARVGTTPDGEEVWRLKVGKDGYWEERAKAEEVGGGWAGVEDIFAV